MKHIVIMILALLLLGKSTNAQVQNKGQWTVFENNKYRPTLDDIVQIAKGMPHMKDGGYYKLKNGEKFWVFCPEKWTPLMQQILSKVKGSPVTDVAAELATGKIIPWDDNISTKTRNYAVTNCKVWIVDENYGGGDDVDGLNYLGYMVLKTFHACCNPEDPKIAASISGIANDIPGDSVVTLYGSNGQPIQITFSPQITVNGGDATATVNGSGNSTNDIKIETPEESFEGGSTDYKDEPEDRPVYRKVCRPQPQFGRPAPRYVKVYRPKPRPMYRQRPQQQPRGYMGNPRAGVTTTNGRGSMGDGAGSNNGNEGGSREN